MSVWLALIILQAYKVSVKIKSESLEADVDTSLFKSQTAEGVSSLWDVIHCPNEHPKFHIACWAGTSDAIRDKSLPCHLLGSVWWQGFTCSWRSMICIEKEWILEDLGSLSRSNTFSRVFLFTSSTKFFL